MTVKRIYEMLCEHMPLSLSENWDNSGFLVGEANREVGRVLVSLDITADVVNEAIEGGYDLIVSHHPLIFTPVKNITDEAPVQRNILNLIKNNIAAICMHTNYDAAQNGVGAALADVLGLRDTQVFAVTHTETYMKLCVFVPREDKDKVMHALFSAGAGLLGNYSECSFSSDGTGTFLPGESASPYIGHAGKREAVSEVKVEVILPKSKSDLIIAAMREAHPYEEPAFDLYDIAYPKEEYGYGRVGIIDEMDFDDFAHFVKERLSCDGIRYVKCCDKVRCVAVGGGACASFTSEAKACGADVFVTGDMSYHNFLDAKEDGFSVIAAGHFQTENVAIQPLASLLKSFGNLYVKVSEAHKACEQFM